jgi:hypothetical protein
MELNSNVSSDTIVSVLNTISDVEKTEKIVCIESAS